MAKARKRQKREAPKPVRTRAPQPRRRSKTADEDAFTQSLIEHGQAAKAGADGKLPRGATHELVENEKGDVKPVRRRFSTI
jgi:hypothetical protein